MRRFPSWQPALLLVAALALTASPSEAVTSVLASWFVDGHSAPMSDPVQIVSDSAIEYSYAVGPFGLTADFTDTGLLLTQNDSIGIGHPVAGTWLLAFFFDTTDWLDGLTLESDTFAPSLTWSVPAPNELVVIWQGGVLPGETFEASFRNASVPEPATALTMLAGLAGLGVLGRRRRARAS